MLTHNIMPETVVQNVHSYYAIKVEEIAAHVIMKQERRNNKFPLWARVVLVFVAKNFGSLCRKL